MANAAEGALRDTPFLHAVVAEPTSPPDAAGKKWQELRATLAQHSGQKLLMVLTGYPDPDNIASGLAHKFLAHLFEIDTTLLCFHEVSHQENRVLVKRLAIDLQLYSDKFDVQPYSLYAFVDTQKVECPISDKLKDKTLLSFVDHHKRLGDIAAEFVDIREEAASTCAIYSDYLRAQYPQGLNPSEIEHVRLATALMHGLRSDTLDLLEASRLEYEAAAYLWPCVDQALLRKISAPSLAPAVMDMIQQALERKQILDNFLFTDVGFVRREHRDGIPQTAEFLLQREGIDTVLVFGLVEGKTIDGSLRTRSDTITPDTFLKKTFGLDEETQSYYGGGNIKDKGGFQIPLGFLGHHPDRELLYRLTWELVHEKFLDGIGRKK